MEDREKRTLLAALGRMYNRILGFEEGADIPATIEGIKRDISFRGHTAWILIFSILICSIGLNTNSPAVIIGAMLISPLMGPILGVGLAVGTQDFETLTKSLKNIGIAVGLGLLTTTLYFMATPLDIEQSELLARTKPTVLDVLIGLFGGFAGIIAGSRKEKTNVVPGVAIATALMPPLCTAGYGLATLNMSYFLGAFYLFFINSVFISLATFIVVRYLKFPLVQYVDSKRLRRYRIMLISFLIITIIPSTIIFYSVMQEARFSVAAEAFVREQGVVPGSELLNHKLEYRDSASTIHLYYIGQPVDEQRIAFLRSSLANYGLTGQGIIPITKNTLLEIHQTSGTDSLALEQRLNEFNQSLRLNIVEDLYDRNEATLRTKDEQIAYLESEVRRLQPANELEYVQLGKELKYNFPMIEKYSYANSIETFVSGDTIRQDTIPIFLLRFEKSLRNNRVQEELVNAAEFLRVRLGDPDIQTIEY